MGHNLSRSARYAQASRKGGHTKLALPRARHNRYVCIVPYTTYIIIHSIFSILYDIYCDQPTQHNNNNNSPIMVPG
jgi:hypothetical protein